MKIAQVSPLYESVPPKLYGGTERIVSYLTGALVALGHDVTLYASGDSETSAKLRPACARSLRLEGLCADGNADHVVLAERVFREAGEFDFVHAHIDYLAFSLFRRMHTPHVTTLHGRLDIPNLQDLYREFSDEPVVSISDRQRLPLKHANWQATVHHGLPENLYRYCQRGGDYLAFIGRINPEKKIEDAIEVSRRTGVPLKIAAKVDRVDREYYECKIKPLLVPPAEYIGEIGEHEKSEFLGNALALLFMVDWPEPFGLAMTEAMACGTPILARRRGSVPEIVEPGVNGFVVETVDEAVRMVPQISNLSRKRCREIFEERFTARRMAQDYVAVYERLRGIPRIERMHPALVEEKRGAPVTIAPDLPFGK
jgi:glycosyltransferase involved in cell wall biosynthesis